MTRWLMTGVTGFLGSSFAWEALRRDRELRLTCIARSSKGRAARARVVDAIASAATNAGAGGHLAQEVESRVDTVEWDLDHAAPMPLDAAADVAQVWHFGARLGFRAGLARKLARTNIDGTRRILEETLRWPRAPFNYVSTAYVSGRRSGPVEEGPSDPSTPTNNPYEDSKRAAESLVHAAGAGGRRIRIFRPSIVVHHSATLRGDSSAGLFGFISVAHALREELDGKLPGFITRIPVTLHTADDAALNLVCVDDVVDEMLELGIDERTVGRVWHVTADEDTPFRPTLAEAVDASLGVRLLSSRRREDLNPVDAIVDRQAGEFLDYMRCRPRFERAPVAPDTPRRPRHTRHEAVVGMARAFAAKLDDDAARRSSASRSVLSRMQANHARSGGADVPYYVGGDGRHAVLVLNAYGQSLHFWTRFADRLWPDARLVMWEMRGTSAGHDAAEPLSVEEHARDAIAILDAEGIERAHVVGWCTGGKLGLVLESVRPDRVSTLCFVTPSFNAWPGLEDLKTPYEVDMEPLCRMIDRRPQAAAAVRQALKAALSDEASQPSSPDDVRVANVLNLVDRGLRTLVVAPFVEDGHIVGYARQLLRFWAHDVRSLVPRCRPPTLVVVGSEDKIASPLLAARVAAALPGARCVEVLGAGHYPHFENAGTLSSLVLAHIEGGLGAELGEGRVAQVEAEPAPTEIVPPAVAPEVSA